MISARRVSVRNGQDTVVKDVFLELRSGETVAVCGEDGTATAFLQVLGGLRAPSAGDVYFADEHAPAAAPQLRARVSYVSAAAVVGDGLRVDEYLRFLVRVRNCRPTASLSDAVACAGLNPRSLVTMLSAADRSSLALAAGLLTAKDVLLIDGALDHVPAKQRMPLVDWMARLRARGTAIAIATQDATVQTGCDRVVRLEAKTMMSDRATVSEGV